MKLTTIFYLLALLTCGVQAAERYSIIPYPNSLSARDGEFSFAKTLTVDFPKTYANQIDMMAKFWHENFYTTIIRSGNAQLKVIKNSSLPVDGYKIDVAPKKITIEASHGQGVSYAITTLRQLATATGTSSFEIPCCIIEDSPSYQWRAFMLDEARHFKGAKVVKQMLDQMAYLKMNILHWHLVDDQGWRIEIKKYPKLTNVAAWRKNSQTHRVPKGDSIPFNDIPHGGFYTQQEIRDIVDYAAKLHITVVPEIEMPGHASAAIAAYPWLSSSDEKMDVPGWFGVLYQAYNVTDERVVSFLKDVVSEVIELFPSKIIHIGGDEVRYDHWNKNPAIVQYMKNKNLVNGFDLQIYFVNRMSPFIESKGAKMMGWNEIMGKNVHEWATDGEQSSKTEELSKNAIVHFWKGDPSLLREAVEKGYKIINSNHWDTYIDYTYERIPMEKSYSFSPFPAELDPSLKANVLGSGCQLWCEYFPKVSDIYRQAFPRLAAYAEVGWTETKNKNYTRFNSNLVDIKRFWEKSGITYYTE